VATQNDGASHSSAFMPTPSETVALCQAEAPVVGADELHTAPSSSAAMHRDADAHEIESSAREVR
jgi:hypothetical protein